MSNILNNTTSLQEVLEALQNKAIPSGTDTSDATATANDILEGETAYIASGKVTGTFTVQDEIDDINTKIDTIKSALTGKAAGSAPKLQEKTATPTISSQNVTPDNGYDGLSKVVVNAIPSTYVQPTASKGATTYTPNTANQTIAAGTYLTGVQTIKGDSNLVASNIKSGVSIFGVDGSYEGSGGGSGGTTLEVVTGTVSASGPAMPGEPLEGGMVYYIDANGKYNTYNMQGTISVMKDSILYASSGNGVRYSGNASLISSLQGHKIFHITGDFTVSV